MQSRKTIEECSDNEIYSSLISSSEANRSTLGKIGYTCTQLHHLVCVCVWGEGEYLLPRSQNICRTVRINSL